MSWTSEARGQETVHTQELHWTGQKKPPTPWHVLAWGVWGQLALRVTWSSRWGRWQTGKSRSSSVCHLVDPHSDPAPLPPWGCLSSLLSQVPLPEGLVLALPQPGSPDLCRDGPERTSVSSAQCRIQGQCLPDSASEGKEGGPLLKAQPVVCVLLSHTKH